MIYNNQEFEILKKATPHFESAKHEYIRNAPRWLTEEVINVYESATGKQIHSKNLSCATCVLRIYQLIGKTYFQDKLEREKISNDKNAKQSESNSVGNAKSNRRNKKENKGSSN